MTGLTTSHKTRADAFLRVGACRVLMPRLTPGCWPGVLFPHGGVPGWARKGAQDGPPVARWPKGVPRARRSESRAASPGAPRPLPRLDALFRGSSRRVGVLCRATPGLFVLSCPSLDNDKELRERAPIRRPHRSGAAPAPGKPPACVRSERRPHRSGFASLPVTCLTPSSPVLPVSPSS